MDDTILRKAGLTTSQAKVYKTLLQHGEMSPVELAKETGESRNNIYAIADKLADYEIIHKIEKPKISYSALHPSALETLAERRRKQLVRDEQVVKQNISPLIDMFYALREEPGARILQGIDGIKAVYQDVLNNGEDIYMLPTSADMPSLTREYLDASLAKRAAMGIRVTAITPNTESGRRHFKSGRDAKLLFDRTFLPLTEYESPVEIQIYGDKTAFIAHGQTQMATIIESPPIAEIMRSLFKVIIQLATPESDSIKAKLQ